MADQYGISPQEYERIKQQAARRIEMRNEFIKQRTNPFKHAEEAGYVFDPAVQRYMAMKTTQFDFFKPNRKNGLFAFCAIILPIYGTAMLLKWDRQGREEKIRKGELLYKDRLFKLM